MSRREEIHENLTRMRSSQNEESRKKHPKRVAVRGREFLRGAKSWGIVLQCPHTAAFVHERHA